MKLEPLSIHANDALSYTFENFHQRCISRSYGADCQGQVHIFRSFCLHVIALTLPNVRGR